VDPLDTPFWDDPKWRAQAGVLWSIVLHYALLAFIPAYCIALALHIIVPTRVMPHSPAAPDIGMFNWLVGAPVVETALLVLSLRWLAKGTSRRWLALVVSASTWGTIATRYGYWGPEVAWTCAVFARCYQVHGERKPSLGTILATASHVAVNFFAFATAAWTEPFVPFQPL
jgi:hypothetical protein